MYRCNNNMSTSQVPASVNKILVAPMQEMLLSASCTPCPIVADNTTAHIDKALEGRHAVIFAGYSGLGYANPDQVCAQAFKVLDEAMHAYGHDRVAMVIGGTIEGIGMMYDKVKNDPHYFSVRCIGIVSEVAQQECPASLALGCSEHLIMVPDPNKTWEVSNNQGTHSYMPYPAQAGKGQFWVFGGGQVTAAEIECATRKGVDVDVVDTRPDPDALAGQLRKGKTEAQLMPISRLLD